MSKVFLIAATVPNWSELIHGATQIFGDTPTRELDNKSIDLHQGKSYGLAIEIMNNRRECVKDVKKMHRSLDFVRITFLIQFEDADQFKHFANIANICSLVWDKEVGIFDGTIRQLREVIFFGCAKEESKEIRQTCNKMYQYINSAGYGDLFGQKKVLTDGTFILE